MTASVQPAWKTRLVPFVIAGALVSGVGGAGAVSLDRGVAVASSTVTSPAAGSPLSSFGVSVGFDAPATGTTATGVPSGDQNAIARLLAAALRKVGGAASAIRAGYATFQRWYGNLPWYVRGPIAAISPGLTVYEIYKLVVGLF